MPESRHKITKLIFRTLLCLYLCLVGFLCFAHFDPEFIQEESQLFNLTDKDVHFIMFLPFIPLSFLAYGNSRWKWLRILLFASGLVITAGLAAWAIELLKSTTKLADYDEAIMNIVMDEAQAFLDGNRSADDVAKAVQSKVKLHVNEQR